MRIKGFYINLKSQRQRRNRLQENLESLNIEHLYKRFEARGGEKKESKQRNLSQGELGLWKSWLELLQQESDIATEDNYDLLHIAEDDIVVSKEFIYSWPLLIKTCKQYDMLATDMYVNPSIHKVLSGQYQKLKDEKKFGIFNDVYTGCTPSMLIPREKVKNVAELLINTYKNEGKRLLPLDNQLRRMKKEGKLIIARMAPFTTGVDKESIVNSSIQDRGKESKQILLTQRFCSLLREDMSTLNQHDLDTEAILIYQQLIEEDKEKIKNANQSHLLKIIMQDIENKKLLKYRYSQKLLGEANNPQ